MHECIERRGSGYLPPPLGFWKIGHLWDFSVKLVSLTDRANKEYLE